MRRILYWGLVLLCLAGAVIGGGLALAQIWEYRSAGRAYEGLEAYISLDEGGAADGGGNSSEHAAGDAKPGLDGRIQADFEALAQVNPQIVGWIHGPDTVISYPVVQGEDNSYYLDHLFSGEKNGSGCIFLDADCERDFSGSHSILYGHHMKNGSMFASLKNYQSQSYYEAHPYFQLLTPEGDWRVDVFSAYIADVGQEAWQLELAPEGYREGWIEDVMDRSLVQAPTAPRQGERILTLSTCSYEFANARFVVHGIIRPWDMANSAGQ